MNTTDSALAIWSPEEVTTIRSVIAPDLTEPEFLFFAQVCRATGLNPLMQQIHAIKRNDTKAPGGKKLTIQTSIHGLRLIADRTKCYAPGREPTFATNGKEIVSATAYVKKFAGGQWHEVADTAYWAEYVQTFSDGNPMALWKTKPHVMIAKCAEALALRRAFPAEMAGLYTDDEMPTQEPAPAQDGVKATGSAVAFIGGADPRKVNDEPRPIEAGRMPADAIADLTAARLKFNWDKRAISEMSKRLHGEGDPSKLAQAWQIDELTSVITGTHHEVEIAPGEWRIALNQPKQTGDADDDAGLFSLESLRWEDTEPPIEDAAE